MRARHVHSNNVYVGCYKMLACTSYVSMLTFSSHKHSPGWCNCFCSCLVINQTMGPLTKTLVIFKKCQPVPFQVKVITINFEGDTKVCIKFHGNPSHRCQKVFPTKSHWHLPIESDERPLAKTLLLIPWGQNISRT